MQVVKDLHDSLMVKSSKFADSVPCWHWLTKKTEELFIQMQPPSSNSMSSVEATEANGYQQELESAVESILLWTQATLVTYNSGGK